MGKPFHLGYYLHFIDENIECLQVRFHGQSEMMMALGAGPSGSIALIITQGWAGVGSMTSASFAGKHCSEYDSAYDSSVCVHVCVCARGREVAKAQ